MWISGIIGGVPEPFHHRETAAKKTPSGKSWYTATEKWWKMEVLGGCSSSLAKCDPNLGAVTRTVVIPISDIFLTIMFGPGSLLRFFPDQIWRLSLSSTSKKMHILGRYTFRQGHMYIIHMYILKYTCIHILLSHIILHIYIYTIHNYIYYT